MTFIFIPTKQNHQRLAARPRPSDTLQLTAKASTADISTHLATPPTPPCTSTQTPPPTHNTQGNNNRAGGASQTNIGVRLQEEVIDNTNHGEPDAANPNIITKRVGETQTTPRDTPSIHNAGEHYTRGDYLDISPPEADLSSDLTLSFFVVAVVVGSTV